MLRSSFQNIQGPTETLKSSEESWSSLDPHLCFYSMLGKQTNLGNIDNVDFHFPLYNCQTSFYHASFILSANILHFLTECGWVCGVFGAAEWGPFSYSHPLGSKKLIYRWCPRFVWPCSCASFTIYLYNVLAPAFQKKWHNFGYSR